MIAKDCFILSSFAAVTLWTSCATAATVSPILSLAEFSDPTVDIDFDDAARFDGEELKLQYQVSHGVSFFDPPAANIDQGSFISTFATSDFPEGGSNVYTVFNRRPSPINPGNPPGFIDIRFDQDVEEVGFYATVPGGDDYVEIDVYLDDILLDTITFAPGNLGSTQINPTDAKLIGVESSMGLDRIVIRPIDPAGGTDASGNPEPTTASNAFLLIDDLIFNEPVVAVPEPATISLLAMGSLLLSGRRRR